jgi:hypothetical protein
MVDMRHVPLRVMPNLPKCLHNQVVEITYCCQWEHQKFLCDGFTLHEYRLWYLWEMSFTFADNWPKLAF